MSDQTLAERLQPSLLDRLTDDRPGEKTERREDRVINVRRLRDIIHRDLSALLNTASFEAAHDLEDYPEVAESVLNYGVRDVTGQRASMDRVEAMQKAIRRAIERFEPRILKGTLMVEPHAEEVGKGAVIAFDIRGDLWAQPVPLELYLRTAINVATGETELVRQR